MMDQGIYYGTIKEFGVGETKTKKTPQVWLEVEVAFVKTQDGQWGSVPPANKVIYWSLSAKAYDYAIAKMESIGWNGRFGEDIDFKDAQIELECQHDIYNDKPIERWDLPFGGSSKPVAVSASVIQQLNVKYATAKRSAGQTIPPPPGSRDAAMQAQSPLPDSDVPPPPSDDDAFG